jgi:hypothetical protein
MKAALYTMPRGRLTTRASVPEFKDLEGGNSPTKFTAQIPLTVPAFLECHVTPADVAEEMARALPDMAGKHVLEPSAGTGSLLDAMKRVHPEAIVQGVEIYLPLQQRLLEAGHNVESADFAEWARDQQERFDAVLMNPPFRKVKEHIIAAFGLLKRGGVMVALVPVTFRDGETYMNLDADTFSVAKVHTKVIKMVKGY